MAGQLHITQTGEIVPTPDVPVTITLHVSIDGQVINVNDALSMLVAAKDYWRTRCLKYESALADLRASLGESPK